ncbi:hypothetical protein J7T55_005485 [Diaporthe amygdali]|uniref:uncharacterized protein n=1 Tax=Phomopsis amygdali TaxID=1214568 RepID=UPI0022FE0777|nr:uncharacterized protein J7T55_005485 [Diaporthe amygdali]KAJ0108939.1 hypothetical protein J7T55_005485 [Diaporthe amygdali]
MGRAVDTRAQSPQASTIQLAAAAWSTVNIILGAAGHCSDGKPGVGTGKSSAPTGLSMPGRVIQAKMGMKRDGRQARRPVSW